VSGSATSGDPAAEEFIPHHDPRLAVFSPQPAERSGPTLRLERFPKPVYQLLGGQIGPLANLRSSSGCALHLRTDSPVLELRIERLRHHQMVPCGLSLEIELAGSLRTYASEDVREQEGDITVRFATGLERGGELAQAAIWMPLISTCAISGIAVCRGARVEQAAAPTVRWLAIGDSLTQGFGVQSPTQNWVHRLSRRWHLPAWNLGVGGIQIEPEAFAWALRAQRFDLVTIALGSNHSWREQDCQRVAEPARALADLAVAPASDGQAHGRIVWLLPPWKPCEEGKGPPDFAGVPLDRAAGERAGRVRAALVELLAGYHPSIEVVGDLMPHDVRLLPDGLHPAAIGFARFADQLCGGRVTTG
jgi:hypothetical protein